MLWHRINRVFQELSVPTRVGLMLKGRSQGTRRDPQHAGRVCHLSLTDIYPWSIPLDFWNNIDL